MEYQFTQPAGKGTRNMHPTIIGVVAILVFAIVISTIWILTIEKSIFSTPDATCLKRFDSLLDNEQTWVLNYYQSKTGSGKSSIVEDFMKAPSPNDLSYEISKSGDLNETEIKNIEDQKRKFCTDNYFSRRPALNEAAPETRPTSETKESEMIDIKSVKGSVVLVACFAADSIENSTTGSGVTISTKGLILTNAHVIPHDEEYLNTYPGGCVIYMPNPDTGLVDYNQGYLAKPKIIKKLGDTYDLATLQIYDFAGSDITAKIKTPPTSFPAIDIGKGCRLKDIQLGDRIKVYGYPDTGSDPSLTVTDGIISKFDQRGYILTNAKINEGNSGGLAITETGCFIGVPEATYSGRDESYGYIISVDLVNEFIALAKNNKELLKDESGKTRAISRKKIESYYGGAPYYISFTDITQGSNSKTTMGLGDKITVITMGDNDEKQTGAAAITDIDFNNSLTLEKAIYVFNEFLNLIDDRILSQDNYFIMDMINNIVESGNSTHTLSVNGLAITLVFDSENSAMTLIVKAANGT